MVFTAVDMICPSCDKVKTYNGHECSPNFVKGKRDGVKFAEDKCSECFKRAVADKKKNELDELKKLSLEERVAKIEEWIYDHNDVPHYSGPAVFG